MKVGQILKDFVLSILIVSGLCIVICLIFYDDISLNKFIPESQEYALSEEMNKEIKTVKPESTQEVVTKYYIGASDLKKYENTNEYNKGKKNPFAEEEIPEENISNNIVYDDDEDGTNFYEDDGTK